MTPPARGRFPIYFTTISFEVSLRDASFWATKVPWLECCVAESDAVKIDPCLEAREDELVIAKKFPSALYETGLDRTLALEKNRLPLTHRIAPGSPPRTRVGERVKRRLGGGQRQMLPQKASEAFDGSVYVQLPCHDPDGSLVC